MQREKKTTALAPTDSALKPLKTKRPRPEDLGFTTIPKKRKTATEERTPKKAALKDPNRTPSKEEKTKQALSSFGHMKK